MKTSYTAFLGLFIVTLFSTATYGQLWQETNNAISKAKKSGDAISGIETSQHKNFQVNYIDLKNVIHTAPLRKVSTTASGSVMQFPDAKGKLASYRLQRVITMHPELAAKYPGIANYVGYDINNPTKTIRITETPKGIHARLSSNETTSYITPVSNDGKSYKVYGKNAIIPLTEQPNCLVGGKQKISEGFFSQKSTSKASKAISDGKLRTLRMALVTTAEFSNYYINKDGAENGTDQEKKAAVIAGLNVLLNSLNDLYEREFSISMVLVPDNDKTIFLDTTTDGLSNNNTGALVDEGNAILNAEIGSDNFDIGHTMGTGGGGLAYFFTPCSSRNDKGRAVSGSSRPEGDGFVFDLWAHEVGHQFTGDHSFNNFCNDNRSNNSAVEPGSGTTIMSYAGICAPNVQRISDHHFHGLSHKQISGFITQRINPSNSCGVTITENNNNAPVIQEIPNYIIPTDTPFVLSAIATDPDNDILTYQFDQMDNEITTAPPTANAQRGPVFRSIFPTTDSYRYFPNINEVLAGNLAPEWEVIPSVSREMNFTVTVRDIRNSLGAQSAFRDFKVNFVKTEPFSVTSQNQNNITWTTGQQQEITWNVAGTTSNGIDTPNVTIILSTDGGQSFDTILATSTPNDGVHSITVPNDAASKNARIMVKGVDNVFFAVNESPIAINVQCEEYTNQEVLNIPDTNIPVVSAINVNQGMDQIVDLKVQIDMEHNRVEYLTIELIHPNGTVISLWNRNCGTQDISANGIIFDDASPAIQCPNGQVLGQEYAPVEKLSGLKGLSASGEWKLSFQSTNGRTGTVNSWNIDICTTNGDTDLSVTEFSTLKGTKIYPNPSNGIFTADFGNNTSKNYQITLYDLVGRKIYSTTNTNARSLINVQNISKGNYLMIFETENAKAVSKIIIQ